MTYYEPQWRLWLDYPYNCPLTPGAEITHEMSRFRFDAGLLHNCFQDPQTGLLMLKPNHFSSQYFKDFVPLSGFTTNQNWFQQVKRSQDKTNMFTNILQAGQTPTLIDLMLTLDIKVVEFSATLFDDLRWSMQTTTQLQRDEGFCWHYSGLQDQMIRKNNWFALQWDMIFIHFSQTGQVRVYTYNDPNNKTSSGGMTKIDEFDLFNPGEVVGRDGFFWFTPIPGFGLTVYHSNSAIKSTLFSIGADAGPVRGHTIKYPVDANGNQIAPKFDSNGNPYLFDSDFLQVALNPYQQMVWGYQPIRYPSTGTATDAIFDIGFTPLEDPSTVDAIIIPNADPNVACNPALWKADNSAAWDYTTGTQARVQMTLTTDNPIYTPFVYAWDVVWTPQFQTRETTPILVSNFAYPGYDTLRKLEFTQDEFYRFEGTAEMVVDSDELGTIVDRGDSTWRLEQSLDGGMTWNIYAGGIAEDFDNQMVGDMGGNGDSGGFYYLSTCSLKGFEQRLRETHRIFPSTFDGLYLSTAFNNFLNGLSFPQCPNFPDVMNQLEIPALFNGDFGGSNKGFQWAIREGDDSEQIFHKLLMLAHTQGSQLIMPFNYIDMTFEPINKPNRDGSDFIYLVPFSGMLDLENGVYPYAADNPHRPQFKPERPEANFILCVGATQNDSQGAGIYAKVWNADSLYNPDSPDYLGREIGMKRYFPPVSSQQELNVNARRMYDACAHWRDKGTVCISHYWAGIYPNQYVYLLDLDLDVEHEGWIKSIAVSLKDNYSTMTITMDSVWESEYRS